MPTTEQLPRSRRSLSRIAEQADTALRKTRWWVLVGVVVAVVAAVVLSGVAFYRSNVSARNTAELVAGNAASTEVGQLGASSLLVARRDLAHANQALVAAGLTPVPDPGEAASAFQVEAATGEALGTLRAVGELQKRGTSIPGVSAPDPSSGSFPGAGR